MYLHGLMRGNSPSTTLTLLILIHYLLHPRSQFPYLTFCVAVKHYKGKGAHILWARSAPQLTCPRDIIPHPTYHLSPTNVSDICTPHHFVLPHDAGGMYPFCFVKSFLCELTLFLPLFSPNQYWSLFYINTVIRSIGVVRVKRELYPSKWS